MIAGLLPVAMRAQGGGNNPAPPATGKSGASIDLTGYWVSVVTEDWRWRMVTPLKGDAASVPINAEARKVVDAWCALIARAASPSRILHSSQPNSSIASQPEQSDGP
jgi:hypothetical protein